MTLILGFGEAHKAKTRSFVDKVADALVQGCDIKEVCKEAVSEEGKFTCKGKDYDIVKFRTANILVDDEYGFSAIIEGTYDHFRNDHPLAPDGVALLQMSFAVYVAESESWGRRVYCCV